MWISELAIRRPVVTLVVMLALVIFGLISLFLLETDEFPDVNPPVVTIAIPYPGASPEIVEREVVDPIEDGITAIDGVDEISSTSYDGYAILVVAFVFEKDVQQATQDIRDKISEIRQELPLDMEEPILTRFDPNDFPIVSLTLSSERLSTAELTALADPGIVGELQAVAGVAEVEVVGGLVPELTVDLHPEKLQAANVSVAHVVQALQAANLAAPVGRVNAQREERTIRLQGRLDAPEDFEDIVVATGSGFVRLGDVATVRAGTEEPRSLALYEGVEAVGIDVVKATGASTTTVAEGIRERVEALRDVLPEGVTLEIVRDSGVRVEESVADVERTLLEGAALTVAVVFVFLASWRSTVITGLALPVSVLASFIAVWAFGFTLNTMSLLGLSLAIGILVDDAIVVRENIVRHMEMGKDHYQAAREGTAEIGLAVAATTFSIIVVFVPIAFMGGLAEQWFAPMALTIASSVAVSLLVSFSLDPMLSAYWPDPEIEGGNRGFVSRQLHRLDRGMDWLTARYRRLVGWALRHRVLMILVALASFAGALALPATGLVGSTFFPPQDRSEFTIDLELPPGSSLAYTRAKTATASRIARGFPEVLYTYATIGGEGETVDEAKIYVRLVPRDQRPVRQEVIADAVRERVDELVGVEAAIEVGLFGQGKEIEIELRGPDSQVLAELAETVSDELSQVPGAVDVGLSTRGQKPEIEVIVARDLASELGLSVGQIAQALRPAFAGIEVGDWVDPDGETREVRVRFAPESRGRTEDLATLPLLVPGPDGASMIQLGHVAEVELTRGPAQIQHLDRDRVVVIGANTRGRPLSEVLADARVRLDTLDLPPGYEITQGGDVERQQEVFGRMFVALGVAILLMYLILVLQFGSFLDPVAILVSLPLSLIGVMLAMLVTDTTLNLMSMIGIVLLMGIVAKNAILLIDFAKWAHEAGMPRHEAIVEAGGVRLRPILMTSVAIIAGMLPVAIGAGEGADFRAPLGRAVIGGVITSTLLTLLVIPTVWDLLASGRERALRLIGRSGTP